MIVSAVRWLQGTLLGTVATVVAVIAVASVGFLMLTGPEPGLTRDSVSLRFTWNGRVIELVDSKIMPNVDFQRMTASAVGPAWRQATPEHIRRRLRIVTPS